MGFEPMGFVRSPDFVLVLRSWNYEYYFCLISIYIVNCVYIVFGFFNEKSFFSMASGFCPQVLRVIAYLSAHLTYDLY